MNTNCESMAYASSNLYEFKLEVSEIMSNSTWKVSVFCSDKGGTAEGGWVITNSNVEMLDNWRRPLTVLLSDIVFISNKHDQNVNTKVLNFTQNHITGAYTGTTPIDGRVRFV